MGIQIPGWLQEVGSIAVGADWPEADETSLRRIAEAWRTASSALDEIEGDARSATTAALGTISGDIHDQMAQYLDQFLGDGGTFTELMTALDDLAEACEDFATEVEYAKIAIIGALTLLAVELAALAAAAIPTLGGSLLGSGAAILATQIAVRSILRQLVLAALRNAAAGVAASAAFDGIIQGIQVLKGGRGGFNVQQAIRSGAFGALDGLIPGIDRHGPDPAVRPAGLDLGASTINGPGANGPLLNLDPDIKPGLSTPLRPDYPQDYNNYSAREPVDPELMARAPDDLPETGHATMFDGYDQYAGMSEDEFASRYWDVEARGGAGGWRYPENDGIALTPDGTNAIVDQNAQLPPGTVIDRFGSPNGSYLSPDGTPYANRALPPTNLGSGYHRYEITGAPLPDGYQIESSIIAPGFGQPGGGLQYRIVDSNGRNAPVETLVQEGYLIEQH